MNYFEAQVTCFPVFVAGIRHFYHGPAPFGHPQLVMTADKTGMTPMPPSSRSFSETL
jgi:hypothetical protein